MSKMIREQCKGLTHALYCPSQLSGSIKDVIRLLEDIQNEAISKGYVDISIDVNYGYDNCDFEIFGSRSETPKERERRLRKRSQSIESHKRRKDKVREKELQELKRLSTKYKTERL